MKVKGEILVKPLISEKSTQLSEKLNKYTFIVNLGANKIEIKKAVQDMYGVNVKSVRTTTIAGKAKTRYTKTGMAKGQTNTYKKALVTLEDGDIIDFYSNI